QRNVMSLETPAPGAGCRRLAENRDVVQPGIPARRIVLDLGEHRLERTYGLGLRKALFAQPCPEQVQRDALLVRRHALQRQARARLRHEMPVEALLRVERKLRRGAALLV